jgi:hypothetical protein
MSELAFHTREEAEAYAAEGMARGCLALIVIDGDLFIVQLWDRKK